MLPVRGLAEWNIRNDTKQGYTKVTLCLVRGSTPQTPKGALTHWISSNGSAPTSNQEFNMTEIEKLKKEIEDLKLIIESKNNQVESKNKHIKRLERIISNIKKEQSQQ